MWAVEVFDPPSLLLGGPHTHINWHEAIIETVFVVFLGFFTISVFIRRGKELKRVGMALEKSEEKYRSIIESIEEGYNEIDIAGRFIFFNDPLSKLLGYPREELTGMSYQEFSAGRTTANKGLKYI